MADRTALGHRRRVWGCLRGLGGGPRGPAQTAMGHRTRRRGAWGRPQKVQVRFIHFEGKHKWEKPLKIKTWLVTYLSIPLFYQTHEMIPGSICICWHNCFAQKPKGNTKFKNKLYGSRTAARHIKIDLSNIECYLSNIQYKIANVAYDIILLHIVFAIQYIQRPFVICGFIWLIRYWTRVIILIVYWLPISPVSYVFVARGIHDPGRTCVNWSEAAGGLLWCQVLKHEPYKWGRHGSTTREECAWISPMRHDDCCGV